MEFRNQRSSGGGGTHDMLSKDPSSAKAPSSRKGGATAHSALEKRNGQAVGAHRANSSFVHANTTT